MWHGPDETPKPGMRIIAPYNDGSGALLFIVVDDMQGGIRLIDEDGDEYDGDYLKSAEACWFWAELPEGSKLWCEVRSDDPVIIAPTPA